MVCPACASAAALLAVSHLSCPLSISLSASVYALHYPLRKEQQQHTTTAAATTRSNQINHTRSRPPPHIYRIKRDVLSTESEEGKSIIRYSTSTASHMQYIVCLGDSLTQQGYASGWLSKLADYYVRRATVVNAGLSGYNSRWVLELLRDGTGRRQLLIPPAICGGGDGGGVDASGQPTTATTPTTTPPLFVTLLLGSNDLCNKAQHVPLGEFIANMESILKLITAELQPRYGIFLLTPPPVFEEARRTFICGERSDRTLADTRLYRAAVGDVAANFAQRNPSAHVTLVDVHSAILFHGASQEVIAAAAAAGPTWQPPQPDALDGNEGGSPVDAWTRLLLDDGLHIGPAGGEVFYQTLMAAIAASPHGRALEAEAVPCLLPTWAEKIAEEEEAKGTAAAEAAGAEADVET